MNITTFILDRELRGRKIFHNPTVAGNSIQKRVDDIFNQVANCIQTLRIAIDSGEWDNVEHAVGNLIHRLLDSSNPDQLFVITPIKKQEREIFVALGGTELLLRLFQKPFCEPDARQMTPVLFQSKSDLWNEVLVILREVAFAIPSLSEHAFGKHNIVFFFTLLRHNQVFENTMNLLEEILSVRSEIFSLSLIPNFYSLVASFSIRQLAHFCRVLSLLLFEPEDRQIMEGSHVLRSVELLQLRRDRMAKTSNIVERNQSLVSGISKNLFSHPTCHAQTIFTDFFYISLFGRLSKCLTCSHVSSKYFA